MAETMTAEEFYSHALHMTCSFLQRDEHFYIQLRNSLNLSLDLDVWSALTDAYEYRIARHCFSMWYLTLPKRSKTTIVKPIFETSGQQHRLFDALRRKSRDPAAIDANIRFLRDVQAKDAFVPWLEVLMPITPRLDAEYVLSHVPKYPYLVEPSLFCQLSIDVRDYVIDGYIHAVRCGDVAACATVCLLYKAGSLPCCATERFQHVLVIAPPAPSLFNDSNLPIQLVFPALTGMLIDRKSVEQVLAAAVYLASNAKRINDIDATCARRYLGCWTYKHVTEPMSLVTATQCALVCRKACKHSAEFMTGVRECADERQSVTAVLQEMSMQDLKRFAVTLPSLSHCDISVPEVCFDVGRTKQEIIMELSVYVEKLRIVSATIPSAAVHSTEARSVF